MISSGIVILHFQSTYCEMLGTSARCFAISGQSQKHEKLINFQFVCLDLWFNLAQTKRAHVRSKYAIPESDSCPTGCEDMCCSLVCPCFTVGQLLRHTTDYDTYEAKCCSSTGLPKHVPAIVWRLQTRKPVEIFDKSKAFWNKCKTALCTKFLKTGDWIFLVRKLWPSSPISCS